MTNRRDNKPDKEELNDAVTRWGFEGAAEEYEVSQQTICAWMRSYEQDEEDAAMSKNRHSSKLKGDLCSSRKEPEHYKLYPHIISDYNMPLSTNEVAAMYNLPVSVIRNIIMKYGKLREPHESQALFKKDVSPEQEALVLELYKTKGMLAIAKQLNASKDAIKRCLVKHNIPARRPGGNNRR
jgi:transposase